MVTSTPSTLFGSAELASENTNAKPDLTNEVWQVADINGLQTNWDKLFPYQLLVLKRTNGNWEDASGTGYASNAKRIPRAFTLPIPPQTLNLDMTFAAQVEASQGGIVEQFSASRFRDITMSGTTGVLPLRGATAQNSDSKLRSIGFSFAAGTINTLANAQALVVRGANASGAPVTPENVVGSNSFASISADSPAKRTGYYQFLLLKRFLEWYDTFKSTKEGQSYALGLAIWKEREIYLCTPQKFTLARTASSGLEYPYSLVLRSWKRVVLKDSVAALAHPHFPALRPNMLATLTNTLTVVQYTLKQCQNLLQSVIGDATRLVIDTSRQMLLTVKSMANIGYSVGDFPESFQRQFDYATIGKIAENLFKSPNEIYEKLQLPKDETTKQKTQADLASTITDLRKLVKGNTSTSVQSSVQQSIASYYSDDLRRQSDRANQHVPDWRSQVAISALDLPASTRTAIDAAIDAARQTRREDYEILRNKISVILSTYSYSVGAGSADVVSTYQLPITKQHRNTPTDQDWVVMGVLGDLIQSLDSLAASATINQTDTLDLNELVAGYARGYGIAFTVPTSKFLVPVPYGATLETLAAQYLGSPDRWMEIATLNGLRAPYIDETGVAQSLLTNGSDNKIAVANGSVFYIGQPIWLSAVGLRAEKRHVIGKADLNSGTLLTLDGDSDLEKYKLSNNTVIRSYLPDTTNSEQFIYIPSTEPVESDWLTKPIPGIDNFDPMYRIGGADFLLDNNGDLVVTAVGTKLAVGLTNIIQQIKTGFRCPKGYWILHPEYGFGVKPGTSTADVSANDILQAANEFVQTNRALKGVESAAVRKNGNSLTVNMSVGLKGVSKNVPISVTLQ